MTDTEDDRTPLTRKQIELGRTPRGGFTRAQLTEWGVPWPPPKGWLQALLRGDPIPPGRVKRPARAFVGKQRNRH